MRGIRNGKGVSDAQRRVWLVAAILWSVLLGSLVAGAQTAGETLDRVRERYASIDDAQISFTQRTVFAGSRVEQSFSGTLLLKKENMYRVEMEGQTIVTDGKTVWSFSRPTNQVLIDLFSAEARGLSPERILTGEAEEYNATLLARESSGGRELIGLKLTPRAEGSATGLIRLWVDAKTWLIRKAMLEDGNGKETLYAVTEIHINTGIPQRRFVYEIPEGAEVVDLR